MDQINNISAEATTSFSNKSTELDNYRQYQEENNYNVKSRSEESDNHSSVSSTETSPISSDGEDQDVQEAASENNGWVTDMPLTSLEPGNRQVIPINVLAREHSSFGNVFVKNSDDVHVGSKTIYNGPMTVHQYLYNKSTLPNENKNSPNEEVNVEDSNRSCDEEDKILLLLRSKRFKIILGAVILILVITAVGIWLLNNLNSSANSIEVPSMPTGPLDTKQLNAASAMITWDQPEHDGGVPLESFKIEKKDKSKEFWIKVAEVNANINNFAVKNLLGDHEYFFRIFAKNKVGYSVPLTSETALLMKKVPSSPQKPLDINQTAEKSVFLRWAKPKDDGKAPIQRYRIDVQDVDESKWSTEKYVRANYQNATIPELQNDHKYFFRIYAINEVGLSKPLESEEPFTVSDRPVGLPDIVSREEWQAVPPVWPPEKLKTLPASHVIICSTRSRHCENKTQCIREVQIEQKQSIDFGFGDIAYNFLIGGDGLIYVGRDWDIEGNHTSSFNNKSMGIAFVGDYVDDMPTDMQIYNLKKLLQYGLDNDKLDKYYKLVCQSQITDDGENPGYMVFDAIVEHFDHWSIFP